MEKDKNMVAVAEDLIKEPPFAVQQNYCQNKNNGLSELDFSQRNSSVVAKPECIISRSMVSLKMSLKNCFFKVFLKCYKRHFAHRTSVFNPRKYDLL